MQLTVTNATKATLIVRPQSPQYWDTDAGAALTSFSVPEVQTQAPEEQLWSLEHCLQVAPPVPQAELLVPALHVVPEQHPVHLFVGHVPPQPSAAPLHFPVQFGVQIVVQIPLEHV